MNAARFFAKQYSVAALSQVYEENISLTNAVGVDRLNRHIFEDRLVEEIELISRKIKTGNYNFSQYKEKLISKGAGKNPRVISIPTFRDRITLRALCNVLRATYQSEIDSKLPQHTIKDIRAALKNDNYTSFIKLDVKNFYPSVNHEILKNTLKKKIRKPILRDLVASAIKVPTVPYPDNSIEKMDEGVPQGLSISNVLAEIYLHKFDEWLKKSVDVAYFRYVDDILILTKNDALELFSNIKSKLDKEYKLTVHDLEPFGKSAIGDVSGRFQFLGYDFANKNAGIKIESIRRLESSLVKIFTTFKYKMAAAMKMNGGVDKRIAIRKARLIFLWRLNLRITGCIFEEVRRGWVFYFSQIDITALKQLHHLDKTVNVLVRRFSIDVQNGEIKSFVRSYHESERTSLKQWYIPNFDTVSIEKQREILDLYGLEGVDLMTDVRISHEFKRRIRKETSDLELDIQGIS